MTNNKDIEYNFVPPPPDMVMKTMNRLLKPVSSTNTEVVYSKSTDEHLNRLVEVTAHNAWYWHGEYLKECKTRHYWHDKWVTAFGVMMGLVVVLLIGAAVLFLG